MINGDKMICRQCNKKQHACSSCGLESWGWDFCSWDCRSEYVNDRVTVIESFKKSLSKKQRGLLKEICEDEHLLEDFIDKAKEIYNEEN